MSAAPSVPGYWRLFAPAIIGWAVVAALLHTPGVSQRIAVALTGGGALWLVFVLRRKRGTGAVLLWCALIAFMCVRLAYLEGARDAPELHALVDRGNQAAVTVELFGYPAQRESIGMDGAAQTRAWASARITAVDAEVVATPVPVMLWLPAVAPPSWGPGTVLELRGTAKRGPPAQLAAYEIRVREMNEIRTPWSGKVAAQLRASLRDAAAQRSGAAMVPGLAVGDTSLIGAELESVMQDTSLTHLVAVSGSNCALITGAVVAVAARLGCGRRLRVIVAGFGLTAFVFLVGPDPSVQRAAVMAAVVLLSGFGGRRGKALPALGLAIILLLLRDPWQAMQAGFALSVVATAGILLFTAPVDSWIRSVLRFPRVLSLPLAVVLVAQVVCAPLILLFQPGIPVVGVLANLLAAPVAPAGTALGVIAMVLLPVLPQVGAAVLWCAAWAARWIQASGEVALVLPAGRWYWPGGAGGALLLAGVEVLLGVAWAITRGVIPLGSSNFGIAPWAARIPPPRRVRMWVTVLAGLATGVIVAFTVVIPTAIKLGVPKDWAMVTCDVGQGDALLVRDPEEPDEVMLVDTGADPELLTRCLDTFGVTRIALLVITHDDHDHMGAASRTLPLVDSALIAPAAPEHVAVRPLRRELERAAIPVTIGTPGMKSDPERRLRWQVLGPEPRPRYDDTNATSIVLLAEVAGVHFLFLGDTGEDEQRWLQRRYPNMRAGVVKIAHHGSRDQHFEFYQSLEASLALVSVGENRYGHPNGPLIDALEGSGTSVYRTDELGSIALTIGDDAVVRVHTVQDAGLG